MAKIKRIELYEAKITYREPIRISLGSSITNKEIVVRIIDDEGLEGWGESSPSLKILGETVGSIISASDIIAPSLIGSDPEMLELAIETVYTSLKGNEAAKAAYDIALHDLFAKRLNVPLYHLLGGYRDRIETDYTIGIVEKEAAKEKAKTLLEHGFKRIKLKVGAEGDLERVAAVRGAIGKDVSIFVDANQAWSPSKAIRMIKMLERNEIELVEQPVKAWDIQGMAYVRKRVDTPIMADESVHTAIDVLKIVKAEAADYINIKLMKCGGIREAKKIAEISESAGIKNIVGCMFEAGISIAAGVHFSCSTRNVEFVDLDSDLGLVDNFVVNGPPLKDGYRIVPQGSGLGDLKIDISRLKKVRVYEERKTESSF